MFDRRCPALDAKEVRREAKAEGSTPGPTHVSGEWRAPATSQHPIRTGNDAGTTRRALLAPLPFVLPSSPSSLLPTAEFSSPFSLGRTRPRSSLIPLLRGPPRPHFIIFYFVIVITFIIIMCRLLRASEFDDVPSLLRFIDNILLLV